MTPQEIASIKKMMSEKLYQFAVEIGRTEGFTLSENNVVFLSLNIKHIITSICQHCLSVEDFVFVVETTRKSLTFDEIRGFGGKEIALLFFDKSLAILRKRNYGYFEKINSTIADLESSVQAAKFVVNECEQGNIPDYLLGVQLDIRRYTLNSELTKESKSLLCMKDGYDKVSKDMEKNRSKALEKLSQEEIREKISAEIARLQQWINEENSKINLAKQDLKILGNTLHRSLLLGDKKQISNEAPPLHFLNYE